ncbi:MAG: hypothetical protein ACLUTU_18075 [Blautia faecis]
MNQEVGVPLHVGDDDLAGTFTFLNAAEDFRGNPAQLKSEDFGRTWMDYIIENKTIFWWGIRPFHRAYSISSAEIGEFWHQRAVQLKQMDKV